MSHNPSIINKQNGGKQISSHRLSYCFAKFVAFRCIIIKINDHGHNQTRVHNKLNKHKQQVMEANKKNNIFTPRNGL